MGRMGMEHVSLGPVPAQSDLRDMLRRYLIRRSLACMAQAAERRQAAIQRGELTRYCAEIRQIVRGFYGEFPAGRGSRPVQVVEVSRFVKHGYRLENVLFESFPGWQVNATVYVPLDFQPPFPAVVIPVGHSGKQFTSYQLPAQYFARCGYLAVLFDPPGQAGEKRQGNDHFVDGVRCYLVGETSSRYFVADAMRCIDYLETRPDVDLHHGVAMTGVSGGGTTTLLAAMLDDRVTVIGPSCCAVPLATLDITACYPGCPETHMWRRYAEGVDEVDLLCAAFPRPVLLMAGVNDEVFRIADTRRLADEVSSFYARSEAGERFAFFEDWAGHSYTLAQANAFVRFMNRWLLGQLDRAVVDPSEDAFVLDPYDEIRCFPNQEVNMRALTLARGKALERERIVSAESVRRAAADLVGVTRTIPLPEVTVRSPFRVWTHDWQPISLYPEEGIELPATLFYPHHLDNLAAVIVHFDDQGRDRLLYRHGLLARAARFLLPDQVCHAVFTVDLRGWGDATPAIYPYEVAAWAGLDRYLAYTSAALGDSLIAMRVRDALSALRYLQTRQEVRRNSIVVTGCGLGGVVALHVAAIAGEELAAVVVWDSLVSFRELLDAPSYAWPADAFFPNVLLHYDLPDLVRALPCPVKIINPRDAHRHMLSGNALAALNDSAGRTLYANAVDEQDLLQSLIEVLEAF